MGLFKNIAKIVGSAKKKVTRVLRAIIRSGKRRLIIGTAPPYSRAAAEYFGNDGHWVRVSSSNVHSIAYFYDLSDPSGMRNILGVRFAPRGTEIREYSYEPVPISVWTDFLAASSKGKFVWQKLRDKYPYLRH